MKALMLALMVWASAHTGLPVPDRLPEIRHIERCALQRANGQLECSETEGVQAQYLTFTQTIYLPDDWQPTSLFHVSMLLHELVHHMQARSGMAMGADNPCPGRNIELPAYRAQIDFLKAAGVDPWATMKINDLWLMLRTRCPHEEF